MKKNYLKPEITMYDVMPCEILAGSKGGETEKLGDDGNFDFETLSTTTQE